MRPGVGQKWCDGFMVRMRLAGWSDQDCIDAGTYLHKARRLLVGEAPVLVGAWVEYAAKCDRWLETAKLSDAARRNCTLILPNFPLVFGLGLKTGNLKLERTPQP